MVFGQGFMEWIRRIVTRKLETLAKIRGDLNGSDKPDGQNHFKAVKEDLDRICKVPLTKRMLEMAIQEDKIK